MIQDRWWHATINWNSYTAFVSTFASEHEMVDSGMMMWSQHQYRHHPDKNNDEL
jgi:hypothetical protein